MCLTEVGGDTLILYGLAMLPKFDKIDSYSERWGESLNTRDCMGDKTPCVVNFVEVSMSQPMDADV